MNPDNIITRITPQASDVLKTKLTDAQDRIEAALVDHIAAQQETEGKAAFSIGFTIKIQPGITKVGYTLAFSQRFKDATEEDLPNPNQPKLPGMEDDE